MNEEGVLNEFNDPKGQMELKGIEGVFNGDVLGLTWGCTNGYGKFEVPVSMLL
jgi:hypothetical protein